MGRSDLVPPQVEVDHLRFLNHAHVLQGTRLCLYLDPVARVGPVQRLRWARRPTGRVARRRRSWSVRRPDRALPRRRRRPARDRRRANVVIRDAIGPESRPSTAGSSPARRTGSTWPRTARSVTGRRGARPDPHAATQTCPLGAGTSLALTSCTGRRPVRRAPVRRAATPSAPIRCPGLSAMVLTVLGASAIRKPDGTPQRFVSPSLTRPAARRTCWPRASRPPAPTESARSSEQNRNRSSMIDIDPARSTRQPVGVVARLRRARRRSRPAATLRGRWPRSQERRSTSGAAAVSAPGSPSTWFAPERRRSSSATRARSQAGCWCGRTSWRADVGNTKVEALAAAPARDQRHRRGRRHDTRFRVRRPRRGGPDH